jgi:hypothetical protein
MRNFRKKPRSARCMVTISCNCGSCVYTNLPLALTWYDDHKCALTGCTNLMYWLCCRNLPIGMLCEPCFLAVVYKPFSLACLYFSSSGRIMVMVRTTQMQTASRRRVITYSDALNAADSTWCACSYMYMHVNNMTCPTPCYNQHICLFVHACQQHDTTWEVWLGPRPRVIISMHVMYCWHVALGPTHCRSGNVSTKWQKWRRVYECNYMRHEHRIQLITWSTQLTTERDPHDCPATAPWLQYDCTGLATCTTTHTTARDCTYQ